mmetsp:Transcript_51449/g.161715  ORF Transcript_51449/g.161715 Transcript_51449/m.161715 type:complete len:123 (+) Transcript_51449:567-935(+)
MLPTAEAVIVKLEVMRANCCPRWHQDQYVSRAIVSYNCCGTEYAHHDNVDFWELMHCGNNDCIIRDRSQVSSVDVGDMLLMKGTLFPGAANGLVHRSPDRRYHADGSIKTRLCLKIDVPELP